MASSSLYHTKLQSEACSACSQYRVILDKSCLSYLGGRFWSLKLTGNLICSQLVLKNKLKDSFIQALVHCLAHDSRSSPFPLVSGLDKRTLKVN